MAKREILNFNGRPLFEVIWVSIKEKIIFNTDVL